MIEETNNLIQYVQLCMKSTGIQRLSIGQQVVVKIALPDFVQAFGRETKCYKLGSEIRYDANGITYVADDEIGVAKERVI